MASFVSANLGHELTGGMVTFTLDMKIRFEPHEVGHRWLVQYEYMEEDPVKDDSISKKRPAEAFGQVDARYQRHYIMPSQDEVELSYTDEIAAHQVDTEIGKEEVYVKVQILPLERPEGFVPAKTRTNITKVDV
jgi:hypothetical protein